MKPRILWIASTAVVIVIFQICYGLEILLPTNISWLMTVMHDWGTHYLGWFFYKSEAWHFPLGRITNYFYPIGTNVGFTDSIPLLAIFFKLFKNILPDDFQYFGIWLFSCHLLAAYFSLKICQLFKLKPLYSIIVVAFVASNPVLVYRGLHPALCAQWLLIASLYYYFLKPSNEVSALKIMRRQFLLLILAALINPYLCFMVLGFNLILPLRIHFYDKLISLKILISYGALCIFSILLGWYLVGLVTFGKKENLNVDGGFGLYSLNLNALFNPSGYSRLFPPLKQVSWHQYEGFMYLGAGIFLLLAILFIYSISTRIRRRKNPELLAFDSVFKGTRLVPLIILLAVYALFSITHVLSFNDEVLFKLNIPDFLIKFGEIFRASARFFWVIYYAVIFLCFILVARSRLKESVKLLILSSALIIQFYDTSPLLNSRKLTYGAYTPPIDMAHWSQILKNFDQIVFYPAFQATYVSNLDYQYFSFLAGKARKPINIGYVARSDNNAIKNYNDSLDDALSKGKLSSSTLYITTESSLEHFSLPLQTRTCTLNFLDGYYYLFAAKDTNLNLTRMSQTLNRKNESRLDSALNRLTKKIEFLPVAKLNTDTSKKIIFSLGKAIHGDSYLYVNGWAFIDQQESNKGDSIFFILKSDKKLYLAPTNIFQRPDITEHFHRTYLNDAGFDGILFKDSVKPGKYQLGIGIKNNLGVFVNHWLDSIIDIGTPLPGNIQPEKITSLPDAGKISFGIDLFELNEKELTIGGWASFDLQDANSSLIKLILKSDNSIYSVSVIPSRRPDVTKSKGKGYDLDNSGFNAKIDLSKLPGGKYLLGLLLQDQKTTKKGFKMTDKQVTIP